MTTPGGPRQGALSDWAEIVVTEACNQRCVFCYAQARREGPDLPLERVRALFEAARQRARRVMLCGREALLRPDILEVVRSARHLGLAIGIATNGQALARPGFLDALLEAGVDGLQVSYHFPDAATFARWTRSDGRAYERVQRGLAHLAARHAADPARAPTLVIETETGPFNAGRLADIRAHLHRVLGPAFVAWRLGALVPAPVAPDVDWPMGDDLHARRAEIAALLAAAPSGLEIRIDKAPLCLFPGQEHRSLGVEAVARGVSIWEDHAAQGALAPDPVSVGAALQVRRGLTDNPYRWVCRGCALVGLCRSGRTSWREPAFVPTAGQCPVPVRDRSAADVLARVPGVSRAQALATAVVAPADLEPFPEEAWIQAMRGAALAAGTPLDEVVAEGAPLLALSLQGGARARLAPAGWREGPVGWIVGAFHLERLPGVPSDPLPLARLAAQVGGLDAPAWRGEPFVDEAAAHLFDAAWRRLGPAIWPGAGAAEGWRVSALRYGRREGLVLSWERGAEARAEVELRVRPAAAGRFDPSWAPRARVAPNGGLSAAAHAALVALLRGAGLDLGEPSEGGTAEGPGLRPRWAVLVSAAPGEEPHRLLFERAHPSGRYFARAADFGIWYAAGARFDATTARIATALGAILRDLPGGGADPLLVSRLSARLADEELARGVRVEPLC